MRLCQSGDTLLSSTKGFVNFVNLRHLRFQLALCLWIPIGFVLPDNFRLTNEIDENSLKVGSVFISNSTLQTSSLSKDPSLFRFNLSSKSLGWE